MISAIIIIVNTVAIVIVITYYYYYYYYYYYWNITSVFDMLLIKKMMVAPFFDFNWSAMNYCLLVKSN